MSPFKKGPPENSVGIVIPMRDNLKFFKLTFHSVLSFSAHPFMLTIIDNMSTFTTKTYLRSIQKNHPIAVLPYQEAFNYSAEVNLGLRYMFTFPSVQYGAVLHSDTVVDPGWINSLLTVFRREPEVGIVGPVSNIATPAQERSRGNFFSKTWEVSGFCMMFRREVFEKLGGFDEQYIGGGYETTDFCHRAIRKGWQVAITGETYIHHFSGATLGLDPSAENNMRRNRDRFEAKFPELYGNKDRVSVG